MSSSRKSRRQPRSTQPIIENGPVYYEMLKDAGALPAGSSSDGRQERPIKRRKTIRDGGANNTAGNRVWGDGAGPQEDLSSRVPALVSEKENELTPFKADTQEEEEEEEEGPTVAVAEEEDSDDSEESDVDWEDVELDKSRGIPKTMVVAAGPEANFFENFCSSPDSSNFQKGRAGFTRPRSQ